MSLLDDAQEEVKPDMTPMIDVVFLMIIFFICIDFKVLESKLPAYLPKDRGSHGSLLQPQEQLAVKVFVESEGTKNYPDGVSPGAISDDTKRPFRFVLSGHRVRWEIGPKPFSSLEQAKAELARVAADPGSQIPDKAKGGRKLLGCVIEAYAGTYYEDVVKTADACKEAGFTEIHFGSGGGPKK